MSLQLMGPITSHWAVAAAATQPRYPADRCGGELHTAAVFITNIQAGTLDTLGGSTAAAVSEAPQSTLTRTAHPSTCRC